ncbi:zinc finger BED domain-containing protein 5 [Biomphalaria glabrata]|nr:zinc finger BED domain-containing protein 5 [Biomphalaria glabrata]
MWHNNFFSREISYLNEISLASVILLSNHSWLLGKREDEPKEHLSREFKKAISQSSSFVNFVKSSSNLVAASFEVSKIIAKHGKPFRDDDYIKEAMLECASYLFEDFQNKDKVIQRIEDLPISRNTVKARVMKLHVNIQEQVKKDINACPAYSICLDESTDVTSSARLAIIAKYSKGN